jgi:hypothetical protein
MQPTNNQNIISSTEYFNEARSLYEQDSTVIKYISLKLAKVSIAIHSNLYVADTPEDSHIKKGARYIGRSFFHVVEAIDTKSYFTLGAATLVLSAGIFANKLGAKNTGNYQYTSSLTYFGRTSFATIIFCGFFNYINHAKNVMISRLERAITDRNDCISLRDNEIITYNELTLYDSDSINPDTLSMISQVALKDAEQPVICEKQLYEYKHLVTWHTMFYPNINANCPHNRNKLIWSNVQRVEK